MKLYDVEDSEQDDLVDSGQDKPPIDTTDWKFN